MIRLHRFQNDENTLSKLILLSIEGIYFINTLEALLYTGVQNDLYMIKEIFVYHFFVHIHHIGGQVKESQTTTDRTSCADNQ